MSKLRAGLLFYRYHCVAPLAFSLPGCWLYLQDGVMLPLVFMKAAVNGLVWYFIDIFGESRFYYYYNLHCSRRLLFTAWFVTDLLIFCLLLWLTAITR